MITVQTDIKVLYVEDEPGARDMLTRLLKRRIRDVKVAKTVKKRSNYL